jgi:hypothetical protein
MYRYTVYIDKEMTTFGGRARYRTSLITILTKYRLFHLQLILGQLLCLDGGKGEARLLKCTEMAGTQEWHLLNRYYACVFTPLLFSCISDSC